MVELELSGRPLTATKLDSALYVEPSVQDAILESVKARLNVLLLGPRGAGKTTLLQQLSRRLEDEGWRAAYVDGALASTPAELIDLVHLRLFPAATAGALVSQGSVPGFLARPAEGGLAESQLLLESIRALSREFEDGSRRHAVLLDEASSSELVHAVFGRLRDEIWQLPISWVVAGETSDRLRYLRPPADAFFTRVLEVQPLTDAEAFQLLRSRVPRALASDKQVRTIVKTSTGRPRDLIRDAAAVLVEGADPRELASSRARWDELVAALDEPLGRVVTELQLNGPASASDSAFLARVGFGRSRAAQLFRELEDLGVVEASTEHGEGRRPRRIYGLKSPGDQVTDVD